LWQSGFQFTVTSGVDSADGREDRAIADRHQGSMATIREAKHASPQKPLKSNKMTKQQLIEQVAAKTELKKSEAEAAVDSVLALIAEALRANERVDLRGFGSFVVKERKERQGRNPRTGEAITIAAKRDASFKPGKELTETLAQADTVPTLEDTE
jgi:DNA-binding protein HU-beta